MRQVGIVEFFCEASLVVANNALDKYYTGPTFTKRNTSLM